MQGAAVTVLTQLDWGSVPVWVGTLVASFSVALAAATYRRNVHDKERDQASRVSSWMSEELEPDVIVEPSEDIEERAQGRDVVRVRLYGRLLVANRSEAPAYDIEVTAGVGQALKLAQLPPGAVAEGRVLVGESDRRASINDRDMVTFVGGHPVELGVPDLSFTDALGRRWRRRGDRKLRRVRARIATSTRTATYTVQFSKGKLILVQREDRQP